MITSKNIKSFLIGIFLLPSLVFSQIPEYYANIDFTKEPDELKAQLLKILESEHTIFPYSSASTDTWDILEDGDTDILSKNNVVLLYGYDDNDSNPITDRSRDKDDIGFVTSVGTWNREHVYAKSLATIHLTSDAIAFTDIHNLRAIDAQMNATRSNNLFEDGKGTSSLTENGFYPGDEWRGDVARTIMYMYIRYPDICPPKNVGLGPALTSYDGDMPDIFLKWNALDPPSKFEINRNDVIYMYQQNRNPFIDNPHLATMIWGGPYVEDLWDSLGFTISPTTTSSNIYVHRENIDGKLNYSLYDMEGEKVQSGETFEKIDISNNPSGSYILKLISGNKITEAQIIKL